MPRKRAPVLEAPRGPSSPAPPDPSGERLSLREHLLSSLHPCDAEEVREVARRAALEDAAEALFGPRDSEPRVLLDDDGQDVSALEPEAARRALERCAEGRLRREWARIFRENRATLGELAPRLPVVAWRVATAVASARGVLRDGELLADLPVDLQADWWASSERYGPLAPGDRGDRAMLSITDPEDGERLAVSPPPAARDLDGRVRADYDPEADEPLRRWCEACALAGRRLRIDRDQDDSAALRALCSPWTARLAWPGRDAILYLEESLVFEAGRELVQWGIARAVRSCEAGGLSRQEAVRLAAAARGQIVRLAAGDVDEWRAVVTMRLEDLAGRARTRGELKVELGAWKQLAIVQGLARVAPESVMDDFARVAQRLGEQDRAPRSLPEAGEGGREERVVDARGGAATEPVEEDEEDALDLEDLDQEDDVRVAGA